MSYDPREIVSIEFRVNQNQYYADVSLGDIMEAFKEGGETAVDSLLEEAVNEEFNQSVYYSYDTFEFLNEINQEHNLGLGEIYK